MEINNIFTSKKIREIISQSNIIFITSYLNTTKWEISLTSEVFIYRWTFYEI